MWRQGDTFAGKRIVKVCSKSSWSAIPNLEQVGTLDDTSILDNMKMNAELYTDHRPKWVGSQESAAQKAAM
jgi:hypothetical protein